MLILDSFLHSTLFQPHYFLSLFSLHFLPFSFSFFPFDSNDRNTACIIPGRQWFRTLFARSWSVEKLASGKFLPLHLFFHHILLHLSSPSSWSFFIITNHELNDWILDFHPRIILSPPLLSVSSLLPFSSLRFPNKKNIQHNLFSPSLWILIRTLKENSWTHHSSPS